ncbi:hypothetical protein JI721_00030 [Alicyclobacillus cycloheptanicus]|uniref:Phage phiEco32-like COOH.NH2 ligase-type 2 n=1 Tax=Alicyclobacillus cycloheptanicus TaxID=1457 RepID=A0ABT9XGS9_9BACL|nr:hypothetical protein [Alicyclobacillus cycloheptanicus]MDQ0189305.1 hypothetical protein [Alicyclobacillus cycloheptanicus]WDM01333.1 hypothetical protein JI721_00030 [Alicyclobacillus cycloheptanicus]
MACYILHAGQASARRLQRRVPRISTYRSASVVDQNDIVIRWGDTDESDPPAGLVLNPKDAIARTRTRAAMGRFLRRTGVRFAQKDAVRSDTGGAVRFQRQYRVPLFDLTPLACFRSDTSPVWINNRIQRLQDSFHEIAFDDEKVTMRVIHLAVRALHALGLDFGLVSVGMTPKGILHVLDVTPRPVLEGRMLELYTSAVENFIDRHERLGRQPVTGVMLGTDVELMLRNNAGKMVLASNYFTRKGRVGCDDRSVQFDGKRLPLMELRPEPDANPLGLVNRLRETMMEGIRTINRRAVEWRGGSMPFRPFSTGAHIHFSNVPFSSQLVKALDNYVGIPLMMVEDPKTASLRRPRYGFLGDVRFKGHGGFEYRTPASFVIDPDVTTAAFCLAYVVAMYHRELPVFDVYEENLQMAFYRGDKEALRGLVDRNFANLRKLPIYERFRDHLDWLHHMIQSGWTWDEEQDVRTAWGLPLAAPKPQRVGTARRRRAAQATG